MSSNSLSTMSSTDTQTLNNTRLNKKRRMPIDSGGDDDEEKREKRRVANRKASVACRLRKKIFITELQRQVSDLSRRNNDIEEENTILRHMFQAKTATEQQQVNHHLSQQQIVGNNTLRISSMAAQMEQAARTLSPAVVTMSPSGSVSQPEAIAHSNREQFYAELVKTALAEFQQQRRGEMQQKREYV